MRIAYIKAKNFMIYKKFHKKFKDVDICGIICEHVNNKNKSNRGGKSVILEMISYCLFGISRAKKEIHLIHYGEDSMLVEIGLIDDDGNLYIIKRGRTTKGKGLLSIDWNEKTKDSQKEINKLLGCDGKEFELMTFFKQGEINQFMDLKADAKKEYFMKWFKNLHWTILSEAVGEDLKEKKRKFQELKTKIETLLDGIGNKKKIKKRIKILKEKIELKGKKLKKLEKKKSKLERKSSSSRDFDKIEQQRESLEEDMLEVDSQIVKMTKLKDEIKIVKSEIVDLESKKVVGFEPNKKRYKKLLKKQSSIESEKEKLEELIEVSETEFSGVCPILQEPCDKIKCNPQNVKKWKTNVDKLDASSLTLWHKLKNLEAAQEIKIELSEARTRLKALKNGFTPTKVLKKKWNALDGKIAALNAEIKAIDSIDYSDELEDVQDRIKQCKKVIDNLNQNLGKCHCNLVRLKKVESKVEVLNSKKEKLEIKIADLKYLAFMFGKNGIPSQEIENAFDEIQEEINYILEKLNTALEVSFKADRELGSWEEECVSCGWQFPKGYRKKDCKKCGRQREKKRKDEFHFAVVDNGNESLFQMDSGGGKTFISLAVRVALTRFKQRQTGSKFPILFLDEIDTALDDDAREQLMKLIKVVLMREFGFYQVFWVSHSKKIKESVPHMLLVKRYLKEAKAVWI